MVFWIGVLILLAFLDTATRRGSLETKRLEFAFAMQTLRNDLHAKLANGEIWSDELSDAMARYLEIVIKESIERPSRVGILEGVIALVVQAHQGDQLESEMMVHRLFKETPNRELGKIHSRYYETLITHVVAQHQLLFFVLNTLAGSFEKARELRNAIFASVDVNPGTLSFVRSFETMRFAST